jgi:hypothetical protein
MNIKAFIKLDGAIIMALVTYEHVLWILW